MYKKLDHDSIPANARKCLMKIRSVTFGMGGYQEAQFGLNLDFESNSTFVSAMICGGWDYSIECDKYTKWTEETRTKDMADMCKTISEILKAAKVQTIDKLKNIPVEVVIESSTIKSFRILEEVL